MYWEITINGNVDVGGSVGIEISTILKLLDMSGIIKNCVVTFTSDKPNTEQFKTYSVGNEFFHSEILSAITSVNSSNPRCDFIPSLQTKADIILKLEKIPDPDFFSSSLDGPTSISLDLLVTRSFDNAILLIHVYRIGFKLVKDNVIELEILSGSPSVTVVYNNSLNDSLN